jgi:phospholipase D1/2
MSAATRGDPPRHPVGRRRALSLAALRANPLFQFTVVATGIMAVLTAVWAWTPLRDLVTLQGTARWVESVSARWWTPLLLVVLFVPASLLPLPRQLVTLAAVIVYGPWKGFAIAMAGAELATVVQYYAGRLAAPGRVEAWAGPGVERLKQMLRARGIAAVTAVRLLPLGPFAVQNALAGALRVRLRDLLIGTFLGFLPGMIATTIVGYQLAAGITEDRTMNRWVLGGAVLGLVIVSALSWSWYKRLAREESATS